MKIRLGDKLKTRGGREAIEAAAGSVLSSAVCSVLTRLKDDFIDFQVDSFGSHVSTNIACLRGNGTLKNNNNNKKKITFIKGSVTNKGWQFA